MAFRKDRLRPSLSALDERLASLGPAVGPEAAERIERCRSYAAALGFHLGAPAGRPCLVAVIGGTGTGKSTVVNRLVEAEVSATSFHRTFTNGPVAVGAGPDAVPAGWLNTTSRRAGAADLPVRGEPGLLVVATARHDLTGNVTLVDTPDVDGDQLVHHAEADRVFRWAQGILFVVTPEKYQMTELLGYYRLAARYRLPALFVMNKCEESAVLDDWQQQLRDRGWSDAPVFAIPRDDAAYEPPPDRGLPALREAAAALCDAEVDSSAGLASRGHDLVERLGDQVLAPLRAERQEADRLTTALRSFRTTSTGVDVSAMTEQLQRRMREQSVLYLMGPQRVLQRVRQLPGMLARLPRTAWDLLARGDVPSLSALPALVADDQAAPDFAAMLSDQLVVLQSRIDDLIRTGHHGPRWLATHADTYADARVDPAEASLIAEEELAALQAWLEQHWDRAPRDTRVLERLLKYLPGGRQASKWSEAAPYLLTLVVATHGAFFGPVDLLIIGGFSLATWVGEKISNEVTTRTREANRRIAERFEQLAGRQLEHVCHWLDAQAPTTEALDRLERLTDELRRTLGLRIQN